MVLSLIQCSFWRHQRNLYYKLWAYFNSPTFPFSNQGGQLIKYADFFSCTQSKSNKHLTVPITVDDKVSFTNKYSLIAIINHSGTLNRAIYWAFIKDLHLSSWFSCNERFVFNVEKNSLNNIRSYILSYSKV